MQYKLLSGEIRDYDHDISSVQCHTKQSIVAAIHKVIMWYDNFSYEERALHFA